MLDVLKLIKQEYKLQGFRVVSAHGDNEFASLNERLLEEGISLETCDTNAHVPTIERTNRFLKERIWCIRSQILFACIPKRLTIELVYRATILINLIPRKGGVYDAMSARELVLGKKLQIPKCQVGEFLIGHQYSTNNTEKPRGFDALYLGPNDNRTGHSVFKISSKRVVSVPRCTPTPTADTVITTITELGRGEIERDGLQFSNIHEDVTLDNFDILPTDSLEYDSEMDDDNAFNLSYEIDDEDDDSIKESMNAKIFLQDKPKEEEEEGNSVSTDGDPAVAEEDTTLRSETSEVCGADDNSIRSDEPETSDTPAVKSRILYEISDHNEEGSYWSGTGNQNAAHAIIGGMLRGGRDPVHSASAPIQSIEVTATAMMTNYFTLEASKVRPQYGLNKGLKLFKEDGYMATKHELEKNLIGRGCINTEKMLHLK